jgi:hypothetical protein
VPLSLLFAIHSTTLIQRIRSWFYYHAKQPETNERADERITAPPVNLTSRPPRKVVPLTRAQAYSRLYCQEGTQYYDELTGDWKLYITHDAVALKKYRHLFLRPPNLDLPYVAFQQVILREMIPSLPQEELDDLDNVIDTIFATELDHREHPWLTLKVYDEQEDVDLERWYLEE